MELNVGAFSDTDLYTREIADVFWSLKEQHSLIFLIFFTNTAKAKPFKHLILRSFSFFFFTSSYQHRRSSLVHFKVT